MLTNGTNLCIGGCSLHSWALSQMRPGFLDLESLPDNYPLSDRESEAHRIRIFLPESLVNKTLDLIPSNEAKLFNLVLGKQLGEQLLQRAIFWICRRSRVRLLVVSTFYKHLQMMINSKTYMLLPLVQLRSDEGLACFPQDPLLHKPLFCRIPPDLDTWR